MSERRIVTMADTLCWGANGDLQGPYAFRTTTYLSGAMDVPCPMLSEADGETCEAVPTGKYGDDTPETVCIFKRNSVELTDPHILSVETPHGRLAYDKGTNELVASPFLEKKHKPVPLTDQQGIHLRGLMENHGQALSIQDLYRLEYPNDDFMPATLGGIRVSINRLREVIGDERTGDRDKFKLIATIHQQGYVIRKKRYS